MGNINTVPGAARFSAFYDEFTVVTGTPIINAISNLQPYCVFMFQGTAALNDETTIRFNLEPGNYTLHVLGITNSAYAISTVSIDGVTQGTIDWYTASVVYNVIKTLAVTVSSSGVHSLNFKAASKNAASSNFNQIFTKVWIK